MLCAASEDKTDAVVDRHLRPHDFTGLVPILKGAGRVVRGRGGRDVCYSERTIAARTVEIRDDIIELMAGGEDLTEQRF
ncbi:MAG: hypothetical protein ACKESB_01450 [Candidatus Hodgkinia cicadicola]